MFLNERRKIMNSLFKNSKNDNKEKYTQLKKEGKILSAADLIQQKPVEFLKELESLLINSTSKNIAFGVIDRFSEVVDLLPQDELIETKQYFENKKDTDVLDKSALRELINVIDSELEISIA